MQNLQSVKIIIGLFILLVGLTFGSTDIKTNDLSYRGHDLRDNPTYDGERDAQNCTISEQCAYEIVSTTESNHTLGLVCCREIVNVTKTCWDLVVNNVKEGINNTSITDRQQISNEMTIITNWAEILWNHCVDLVKKNKLS